MKRTSIVAMGFLLLVATPALADVRFEPYDGGNAIQSGSGGERLTRNGVDFWTGGTPERRFRILGTLTDTRKEGPFAGKAIGSKDIAREARARGGDAVVVTAQDRDMRTPVKGYALSLNGKRLDTVRTTFLVIEYLD